ncbi:hypothetical protein [Vibrio misgurnus]|uniref:hypothetical protein n=1 Tax=Vibrio misgurnus TaxID=2993714 RepID=UPI002416CFC3|nr:hypothetical protein [Vibrio sp. gvc]
MRAPKTTSQILATITSLAIAINANASEPATTDVSKKLYVQTGGYTQLKVDTNLEQKYPLLEVRSLEMPASIKYIGQGLNYILSLSGYRLSALRETDTETLSLYSMKLPLTNRTFTTANTLQVVQTLVGVGFDVEVNEISRTVQIKAKENK